MYEPQLWMDAETYPFLVRWGLSTGYGVHTNQENTLLYELVNLDPIRGKELIAEGKQTRLSREEAVELVKSFSQTTLEDYNPDYSPPVRLDEDMHNNYFLPEILGQSYMINAGHFGIFWDVVNVYKGEEVMCRSQVTENVRDLEFDRRMVPYIVRYQHGSTVKIWMKAIGSFEEAVAVLEREKPRHVPNTDWRIYADMTAALRHVKLPKEELPEDLVITDDWLWLRMWYPLTYGGDYESYSFYDNLTELRLDMIEEEDQYIHVVTGIYACVHHDAPPVEEEAPGPKWRLIAGSTARPEDTHSELAGGVAVLWEKGDQVIKIVATSDPTFIDATDLAALNKAVGSVVLAVREVDHAMLFPYYKALKMEGGVEYERYEIDEDDHWVPKES